MDATDLQPLAYHREIVAYLKFAEPEVWAWAASHGIQEQHAREARVNLLREAYRLTAESHPLVHRLCAEVKLLLGVDAAVTIYQAGDGAMNATFFHLPGEAHLVLHGPILQRLDEGELRALLGHELAHYRLWSEDGGDFHVADRILDHVLATAGASASHIETARLFALHTEIYADRGAALAARSADPAITTLIKVQTGLASVDPGAYLQQAQEIQASDVGPSSGISHPEAYLRARALAKWWQRDPELASWLHSTLRGPLSLDRLDLAGQAALTVLTRRFIAWFAAHEGLRGSEAVATQVKAYFPDWGSTEAQAELDEFAAARVDDSVRAYLHSVMFDLSFVDDDLRERALIEAAKAARSMDSLDAFTAALKRDAGYGKRDLDKLLKQLKAAA